MTEQPKYQLYAIKTADLPQDGLKAHRYSYNANGRYALVYTQSSLVEPYRLIREDIALTADERAWLIMCKAEINAKFMRENESEYSEVLNEFAIALEKGLKAEQEKLKGEKKNA